MTYSEITENKTIFFPQVVGSVTEMYKMVYHLHYLAAKVVIFTFVIKKVFLPSSVSVESITVWTHARKKYQI